MIPAIVNALNTTPLFWATLDINNVGLFYCNKLNSSPLKSTTSVLFLVFVFSKMWNGKVALHWNKEPEAYCFRLFWKHTCVIYTASTRSWKYHFAYDEQN